MPFTDEQWEARLAIYQAQQSRDVAVDRAKERYDLRQRMLNDVGARDDYRQERWETLGQAYKASRSRNDPIQDLIEPAEVADVFRQTFSWDRAEEIDAKFDGDYAEHVQDQETKEFLTRRTAIAQAAFEQHKMLNPDASDQDAYNTMHRQLIQYGFQPRGLETLVPFRLQEGRVVQEDYTPVWSEAKSLILGVIRGGRRLGMAPIELSNAGLELATDIYNRNQAGANVTGSNRFRDSRRAFAVHVGAIEQALSPKDIPYNFDVAGVIGEQVPNLLATISGAKMWMRGAKFAGNALAMGGMFALEGANAYNRYMQYGEQQGTDPRLITTQAYAGAMAYGAASAALERLIPMETFKRIPGLKNRAAAWALGSLAEGTTEFLQSLAETGIGVGVDLAEFNWDSIRMAMREAAAGVLVGGVAGATVMGRATPQVDQLSQLDVSELHAKIETELDAIKKRAVVRDEIDPPIQQDEVTMEEKIGEPLFEGPLLTEEPIEADEAVEHLQWLYENAMRDVVDYGRITAEVKALGKKFKRTDLQLITEQFGLPKFASKQEMLAEIERKISERRQSWQRTHGPAWGDPLEGPPVQPEVDVQTTPEAIDRAVIEATGLRSELLRGWRAVVKTPARLIMKIPAESPIGRIRDSIGRGLTDSYGKAAEWVEERLKAKARERTTTFMADTMGALWVKSMKAANLSPQSPQLQAMAELALRGKLAVESLPPIIQSWVQTARTLQDAESLYAARVYRAVGLDQRADTFEKNIGNYLKNIPLAKVNTIERMKSAVRSALGLKVSAAFDKVKRDGWLVWEGKKLIGKFDTEVEAQTVYKTTIAQRKSQVIKKWAKKRGVTARDINRQAAKNIKIEAPLTPEWRREFEIHNPAYLLAASIVETRHDTEMVQLFNTAAQRWGQEAPQGLSDTEAEAWAKGAGLVQLPQNGRLHDLAGIYVPKAIANDLTAMTRLPSMIERTYGAYLSAWKSSKTLWNPATHMRNIFGNVLVFSYLADCSVLNPLNAKYYRQAITSLTAKDSAFITLMENGALGTEYYGAEIQHIERELKGADDSKIGQVLAGVRVVQKTLGKTYAAEDQVFKLAAFHKYIAKGMSPEAASEEVNKWFPNYERIGKLTRWLRKSPIGAPFISFVDQSVRIAGRGFAQKPLRAISIAAMPGMLSYLAAIAVGMSPDEKRLLDKERSYFEPLVPWRNEKGAVQTLDLRYIVPLANDIVPEERRGGLMVPWMFSGPAATAGIEFWSGKERFTGKDIITEDMTWLQRLRVRSTALARAAVPHPSLIYWGAKRVTDSVTGDRDEPVANAIVGSLLGLNIRTPYIAEKHVKQIVQNMITENDWLEARTLVDVWNKRYKPGHLKNLTVPALVKGLRQTKLYKWRKVRDEAATAWLQGREDDAQEIVDDYGAELGPGVRRLTIDMVRYRVKQLKREGRTR